VTVMDTCSGTNRHRKASYIFGAFITYLMGAFISDILGNNFGVVQKIIHWTHFPQTKQCSTYVWL